MSNYKHYTLDDWIECINLKLEYFDELDGNEMRDLVYFLSNMKQQKENKWIPVSERMAEITSGQGRPTAHFIRYINHNYSPFDNSPEYIMRCSNCGGALSEGAFYCPNCGAKMEGETNDR